MYTIGASMGYAFVMEEATFAAMAEAGVGAAELSLRRDPDVDIRGVAVMCRRHGIRLWSCHLPYTPREEMDISIPDPQIRAEGAVIAAEDMIPSCIGRDIGEMQTLLAANDKLRVCFDVNHLLVDSHADFVHALGDKIVTVHISDYDGVNEQHWLPGEGVIDFPAVYSLLRGCGYEGVWIYELSLNGAKSADRGRFLTYRDFRRNADLIFSGKNPPKITPDNLYPFCVFLQNFDKSQGD